MTNQNAGLQTLLQFFSINTASIPERWMRFLHYPHFWYPSSGFDTKPLELAVSNTFPFWDIQTLFLYVDRQEVFTHPDQLRKITNRKNTVPIPASENYHVEVVSCLRLSPDTDTDGPLIRLMEVFVKGPTNAAVLPLIFFRMDNFAWIKKAVDCQVLVHFCCTVTDDCRPDSREMCLNRFLSDFDKIMKPDSFLITDHFNDSHPIEKKPVSLIENWGHYDLENRSYIFRYHELVSLGLTN